MSYRKNEDGTYTAFRLMKFDNTLLEASAADLDNAKTLLKREVEAYKNYALVETKREYFSPGFPGQKAYVQANDRLAEIINKEVEDEQKETQV